MKLLMSRWLINTYDTLSHSSGLAVPHFSHIFTLPITYLLLPSRYLTGSIEKVSEDTGLGQVGELGFSVDWSWKGDSVFRIACWELHIHPSALSSSHSLCLNLQAFLGMIILPIAGNACEHMAAVIVATKNKMELSLGIALGSSLQVSSLFTLTWLQYFLVRMGTAPSSWQ